MDYKKQLERSKFIKFREYNSLNFTIGASLFIAILLSFFSIDIIKKSINIYTFAVSILYFISAFISYIILYKVKKDVKSNNNISDSTRKLGIILISFLIFANIFTASSGFLLITKEKKLEYMFIFEAFLINIIIIFVSAINLFKEVLSDTFYLGISVLLIISIFYIIAMSIVVKKDIKSNKKLFFNYFYNINCHYIIRKYICFISWNYYYC